MIVAQELLPILRAAGPDAFAARPAFEIADRIVGVETGDFAGIFRGPVVDIETAAAQAEQDSPAGEAVTGGEFAVKRIPMLQRIGAAESVADGDESEIKAQPSKVKRCRR